MEINKKGQIKYSEEGSSEEGEGKEIVRGESIRISDLESVFQHSTTAPTHVPRRFKEQFVLFDDGSNHRLYIYIDGAWKIFYSNDEIDFTLYIKKDGTVAFTGEQSMGTNKLTNVVDPAAAQDAATKKYTDDADNLKADITYVDNEVAAITSFGVQGTFFNYPLSHRWGSESNTSVVTHGSVATSASSGANWRYSCAKFWNNGVAGALQFNDGKTINIEFLARAYGTTSDDKHWGFGVAAAFIAAITNNNSFAGFAIDGGTTLYAKTANGSARTTTQITGITTTDWNRYRIEYIQGTSVKYYINGTLKTTITTTISAEAVDMGFGMGGQTNGDNMEISTPAVEQEL